MERLYNDTKTTTKDIFSDPSHRMSQRPVAVKSGQGIGFQALGSSFGPPKPVVTYGKSSKSKSKPPETLVSKPRRTPCSITESESDDELLLSSQNSMGRDATSPAKRTARGTIPSDEEETIRVNGRVLPAHPDYKPSSSDALKRIRFKKNKKSTPAGDAVSEIAPPSSSLTDSQDLFKPISEDVIEIIDDLPPGGPSSTRRKSPSATRSAARRFTEAKDSSTSKPSSSIAKDTTRSPAKPRPKPRVVIKSAPRRRESSPEATPRPVARNRELPLRSKTPELPANANSKVIVKKPLPASSLHREPQEFPMSLQAKENVSDGAWSGDASSTKTKKAVISRTATFVQTPKPIPLPSPLKTKPVSRGITFPNLSPLSSSNEKGKTREKHPDENYVDLTDAPGKRGGPKPFPMSSQMLAGIDRRSKSPSTRSLISQKRASSDDSDAEQGRTAKKHKDSRPRVLDTFDHLHEPMEDDSIELGYARDPSEMCPYCDEELPSHPTPFLQHLLTIARKKSVSDPRPRNRGGLKAPLTIYISVCQRHRFESHQLPIATERGWPKTIDFAKVPMRVKKMKKELEAIILDKDDISDTEGLDTDDGLRGPRIKSFFWREVKKEVKKQGSRTVVGVKGQFASFEKTQPGYYGEQGSVIIHQTLFDLFPPSTFDASLIAPLAPAEFIQRILVPEAAVRLIAQDLCADIDDAIVTLRESAQYGVAMFPDTGENKRNGADDGMDVADKIVMERARARRKELAEEEKVEKEMMEEEQAAQRAKARESRREKALERAQQAKETKARAEGKVEAEDASEVSGASATRRTRQWAVAGDSESDAMSVDSLTSRPSACTARNGVRGKAVRATARLNDSVKPVRVGDSKHKASIRKSRASADPDTRVSTEITASRERKKPFSGFASLHNDGEHESTPRPARQRTTDTATTETAIGSSNGHIIPLQIARNKTGVSDRSDDGWSRNLRTVTPNESDSDMSHASQRSQRSVRRKRRSDAWLFTDSDSDSSDST
ncbi:hypothetical protein J3R82DRAFT_8508 [Butyriboletus roseoflavus]|nr:hypothetical protein J3R82DRAFT_8508 [Butyriboletus roseoflavus]